MDGLAQNCGNCMQCVGSTVMIVLPQAVDKWSKTETVQRASFKPEWSCTKLTAITFFLP